MKTEPVSPQSPADGSRFVSQHLQGIPRSGIRDFFEIVSTRKDVISLGIGEPDFITPWHIREASIYALDRGATQYTANLGLLPLREAIADYVEQSFGVAYDPQREILVTVGVSEALDLAIRSTVNPGDEILYHEPSFVAYDPLIRFAGGTPVRLATSREHGFELDSEQLRNAITPKTRGILLNFPTNPTGATLTAEAARNIAQVIVEHDLIVITDEIYWELTYTAERYSILSEPGIRERAIFLNGFSKGWAMTGFRLGYACAPAALTEAMMKIHQYSMMCAPILSQKAGIEALRRGNTDIQAMRESYCNRRNYVCSALNEAGMDCRVPEGAFYVFPYIGHFGLSSQEFALRLLEDENVACVPGTAFGPSGEGHLRCCYATGMESIKEAMKRIARFTARLRTP